MTDTPDSDLLRAPEAARRLSMRTRDLLRLTYDRAIPHVVVEGVAHYRPADIEAYRLEHDLPEPVERTIERGPVSTTPPVPDALREELAAEHLRDFREIATAEHTQYLDALRSAGVSIGADVQQIDQTGQIVAETPETLSIAEEYEASNEGRAPRPHRDMTVAQVIDWLHELYDTGEFSSQQTWDLIAELVLRIPNDGVAPVPPVSPDVIGCRVLAGHIVELAFDEGTVKAVDLTPFLWGRMFERVVADYEFFRQVHVDPELGTIVWPGDIDTSPEALYLAPAVGPAEVLLQEVWPLVMHAISDLGGLETDSRHGEVSRLAERILARIQSKELPPWGEPGTPRQRTWVEYVTVEEERARLRPILDEFEARYGLASDRLAEAFTVDGVLDETPDFHAWDVAYVTWQALAGETEID